MLQRALITIRKEKLLGLQSPLNILQVIKQKVFPLNLAIEGERCFAKLPWYTSRIIRGDVRLCQTKEGIEIKLLKPKTEPFYIVHNSHPRYFKRLQFAEGVATPDIGALCLGSFGQNEPTLSCSLVVLEFGRNNERIGSFIIPLNTTKIYRPSPEAWRCVICLQFKGIGRCTIFGLRLAKFNLRDDRALQSNKVDIFSPYVQRKVQGLPEWMNEDAIFIRYSDVRKEIEKAIKPFSSEAYKWKRRALDWERQYRAVSMGGQIGKLAHETLLELSRSLPVSNGCRYYKKIPLRVGIITDIYMFNYYKDVFEDVCYLSPDNYKGLFMSLSFDIVLYITCWKGIENEEWRGIKFREKPKQALDAILEYARRGGAKVVFQSIEDPSNYEYFLPIAKKFDYIFTSDNDTIDRYKADCGHDRVFYGEYGVNPWLNNPIGCRRHILNAAFFAGSWALRYKERCEDMETIFDSILSSGGQLVIADRNHGTESEDLRYPERFRGSIMPTVEHGLLQSMHKLFRYNLNFNSIKNSPTMCAMRVYEMQAMGVGIFSNYARSVFNNFPEIRLLPWRADITAEFEPAEGFEEYRRNMALVRNVLNDRTAYDIALRMVKAIGFEDIAFHRSMVCVICEDGNAAVRANFERQRYDHRVLVKASDIATPEKWAAFAEGNNIAYFTWFTSEDEYEENYLNDLVNAFKYTNARYVTRAAWFDGAAFHDGIQHDYTDKMGGKARTLFATEEFSPLEFIDRAPHEAVVNLPGGYAVDPFELNYRRFLERKKADSEAKPLRLSIIVPVFNNGRFLKSKCIESLRRNRVWPQMEVLLVDDGSSDPETIQIVENLAREHGNVRTFFFDDGGSGSASRPRNKGIEMATAPLIAFLDPDNEISPCGYDTLLAIYEEAAAQREGGVDFVSGYHVKVEEQAKTIGKHASQRLMIVENLKERFLESGKFPVIPTQPAVIASHLFESGELRFVDKSVGQDTLFGWELLCQAKSGAFTDAAYLIYYAQRAGSIVNAVDAIYFEKKRILEQAQIAMLTRHGLMDAYLKHHYERFMRDWYLSKLESVQDEVERERCAAIISEIARMYGREMPAHTTRN